MRHITIASTAVLIGLLAGASMAAAGPRHKTKPKCPPAHEKVIAADTEGVIVKVPEMGERVSGILACAYGHRAYVLGSEFTFSAGNGGGVQYETLAGPIVAYEESRLTREGGDAFTIVARNLSNGRVIHKVPTAEAPGPKIAGGGLATGLVVKNDGSVAWIVQTKGEPAVYEVHAVDRTGSRLLASGGDIDPSSLALAGSMLYWTQGGRPASAVLN